MTHLALDLALTTTGVAWGPGPLDHASFTCPAKLRGGERLRWIRRRIAEHIDGKEPRITTLVTEAPFMSRTHPTGAIPLIKLHGAVEHAAAVKGLAHYEVPSATLKAFATNRGNASKDQMVEFARIAGWQGEDHNACDAWWLWRFWQQRERGAA